MIYFALNKDNINNLSSFLKDSIEKGEEEIQILFAELENGSDDIQQWEDEDFIAYEKALSEAAEILTEEFFKNHIVYFSPLTNLINHEKPVIVGDPEQFLICQNCPCGACLPDPFVFKSITNVEFIPPVNFCRRSFVEYKVGRLFMQKVTPSIQLPEIEHKEYLSLVFRIHGNTFGIGADYFGI